MIVRQINSGHELDMVRTLTHESWVASGLILPQPNGKIIHHPHLDNSPDTTVLVAIENELIVGTNSLTVDGPSGLHVDHGFKEETNCIRTEGLRLASSWRIASSPTALSRSAVFKTLIRATVDLIRDKEIETCLFVFPPEFEAFYRRVINAKTICTKKITYNDGLIVPCVMMRCDYQELPDYFKKKPLLA